MKTKQDYETVEQLLHWKRIKILKANHEYQRGQVWNKFQEKMFIDSILREYPVPAIYLHEKEIDIGKEKKNTHYEIIDGQQRMEALYNYTEGGLELIDPKNSKETRFPNFVKKKECPWAGERYKGLSTEEKETILKTRIPVALIQSDDEDEVRDLFIRLQAGLPLNPQEKRDAWPGRFTEFILEIGGKPELPKYPGEPFFPNAMGIKPTASRGRSRETAAQLYMLYESHRENKRFKKIQSKDIDDYYHANIDFDEESSTAKRFLKIIRTLEKICKEENIPTLPKHATINLVLFIDSLMDNCISKKWEEGLGGAYNKFTAKVSEARQIKDTDKQVENVYWRRYIQYTQTAANELSSIESRHVFFFEQMLCFMEETKTLINKDSERAFIEAAREYIFFRDDKKCLMCDSEVVWREAEIHHVIPHAEGGKTEIDNGALVHKDCHPKSREDVKNAKERFQNRKNRYYRRHDDEKRSKKKSKKTLLSLPPGTEARASYGGNEYRAKIGEKNEWIVDSRKAQSPSGAIMDAIEQKTGKRPQLNGYTLWEIKREQDENWRTLQSIRDEEDMEDMEDIIEDEEDMEEDEEE